MTAHWLLGNVMAWSAQVCVLIAVAAGAALGLKTPRARLWFWQAMLTLALLLPLLQPRLAPRESTGEVAISTGPSTPSDTSSAHSRSLFRAENLLFVLAAGTALRLIWISIGFARLRRHRLTARILPDPPFHRSHVRWYLSDRVSGPVTFGWLRPVILLPSRVNELAPEMREAIARHELIHIERRDWLFVIAEELIRAALWFHPAIWFVLSQIQLAREQTVDADVVRRTRDREAYLDALVAVAEQKFFPAPLFLKKRQLAMRVASVLKEVKVSRSRVISNFAAVFSAALIAARVAVWFFPMQSPAQTTDGSNALAGDGPAISIDAGAPLLHRAPLFRSTTVTGTVVVEAMVNSKGEVSDARVVSGPDELRRTVLQSVLQWHYSTANALPSPIRISVRFDPVPPTAAPVSTTDNVTAPAAGATSTTAAILKSIEFVGVSPDLQQRVREALPVREGDEMTSSSRAEILAAAREIDEHFETQMNFSQNHQATLTLILGSPLASQPLTAAVQSPQRIRVGGNVQAANLVQKVVPAYPPDAKAAGIQGAVRLTATIGKDGRVINLQLISGDPMLAAGAMDAVKQWQYKPTLLNGNPVEVITEIDVNFTLSQ